MADKQNTQSILENIRKKIQKFEKPRNADAKLSTTMGDEFEYFSGAGATDTKNAAASKDHTETAVKSPKQSEDHAALEKELDDSFSDFLNKTSDDKSATAFPAKSAAVEPVKDDFNFNIFEENNSAGVIDNTLPKTDKATVPEVDDHRLDFNALDQHPATGEAKLEAKTDVKIEEKPAEIKADKAPEVKIEKSEFKAGDKKSEVKFDIQIDPKKLPENNSVSKDELFNTAKQEDDFLSAKIEDNFDVMKTDPNSANLKDVKPVENVDKTLTAQVMETPMNKEESDDFLKMDIDIEGSNSIKTSSEEMNKLNQISDIFNDKLVDTKPVDPKPVEAAPKPEEKPVENFEIFNKKTENKSSQTLDAVDSIIGQKASEQVANSIKKLVEAKSSASDIASLTKSDKFNDVATQLLEEKLERWLNENLPDLVEKIVREEIKKIVH